MRAPKVKCDRESSRRSRFFFVNRFSREGQKHKKLLTRIAKFLSSLSHSVEDLTQRRRRRAHTASWTPCTVHYTDGNNIFQRGIDARYQSLAHEQLRDGRGCFSVGGTTSVLLLLVLLLAVDDERDRLRARDTGDRGLGPAVLCVSVRPVGGAVQVEPSKP